MTEGQMHIRLSNADCQKIRESVQNRGAVLHIGNTAIPIVLDEKMPQGAIRMASRNPVTGELFVLRIESIGTA